MLFETDRLIVRKLRLGDETCFANMALDGSLRDIGFDCNCGIWIHKWIHEAMQLTEENDPNQNYLAYTVVLKNTDIVIGSVGCSYYEDFDEIGITYFIGSEYRNKGYAAEVARAYTNYFLNNYGFKRLMALIREENVASWKTIEKAGFITKEKKKYKDIGDEKEELYRFYEYSFPAVNG